uniref:LysM domain-containing protein n=1 Tax=Cannabis sativa TaxID=3483 RepID=A0A803QWP6_CANSA
MSEGQCSAKHYLVHVVKRGETLSSISKQHGVSMYEIAAANRNIVDVDLVFEGQQLNIPSASTLIQAVGRSWSAYFRLPKKDHFSLNILNGVLDQKNLSVLYYRCTPHVSVFHTLFSSHINSSNAFLCILIILAHQT